MVGFLGVMKLISMIKCFNETKMLRKQIIQRRYENRKPRLQIAWAQQK